MIYDLFYKIGLVVFTTMANVAIAFTCGTSAMWLCLHAGYGKTLTLTITIAVAVAVTAYIRFNHKILSEFKTERKIK